MTTRPADTASTADQDTITYPETDGMPLPDGLFQAPLYIEVVGSLRTFLEDQPTIYINSNNFIYYLEGDPNVRIAPDCYVIVDFSEEARESMERRNTYLLWEVGKPPDFVLEIGSESTARRDLIYKRELYAQLGMQEYWMYDATGDDFYGEPLIGLTLVDGEYRRIDLSHEPGGMVRGHSTVLNLDLCWDDGRLRFYDPVSDRWLLNQSETKARAEAAEAQVIEVEAHAIAAEAQAEAERAARQSAEARMAAMEAELRRLRRE